MASVLFSAVKRMNSTGSQTLFTTTLTTTVSLQLNGKIFYVSSCSSNPLLHATSRVNEDDHAPGIGMHTW